MRVSAIGQTLASCGSLFAVRGSHGQPIILIWEHKEKRGSKNFCLPRTLRPSHCLPTEDKQRRSPRKSYIQFAAVQKGHQWLIYDTWTRIIALLCGWKIEVAKFKSSADKASIQRCSIMSAIRLHPNGFQAVWRHKNTLLFHWNANLMKK